MQTNFIDKVYQARHCTNKINAIAIIVTLRHELSINYYPLFLLKKITIGLIYWAKLNNKHVFRNTETKGDYCVIARFDWGGGHSRWYKHKNP